jgi:hypothetical protein
MACFLVPAGEAIVTTIVQKVVAKKEKQGGGASSPIVGAKWSQRLGWLNKMLWGGTLLLGLEHIWHGEVVPWPPFLTAVSNPADLSAMLHEMATVGVAMSVAVTAVWGVIVLVAELKARAIPQVKGSQAGGSV